MKPLLLSLLLCASGVAAAQQAPSAQTGREVEQLFVALKQSGCTFYRNGSWHEADEAGAHLRRKYDYLLKKGHVASTEAFIDLAASKSSMSGKPYLVKCGSAAPMQSKLWFNGKLRELRVRSTRN